MGRAGENDSGVSDMFIAVFYWFLVRGESCRYSTQLQSKLISLLFKKFWRGLPWWLIGTLHCTWFGGLSCTTGSFSPVFGSKALNKSSAAYVIFVFHRWCECVLVWDCKRSFILPYLIRKPKELWKCPNKHFIPSLLRKRLNVSSIAAFFLCFSLFCFLFVFRKAFQWAWMSILPW